MIRLLLDQGVPYSAAGFLTASGIDAIHVADLGLGEAEDARILEHALKLKRDICTLDGDFHALMALAGATYPSVILVRTQGLKGHAMADLLRDVCMQARAAIEGGALVTVAGGRVRVRRLPVRNRAE